MRFRILQPMFLLLLIITPLSATEPFPYTWIEKKKNQWEHLHGYLGGAAIVLDDVPNKKKERFWLRDLIEPKNYARYVKDSTAGPIWGENALAYLFTMNQQQCFCVRLAWNERIILNLDTFKHMATTSVDATKLENEEIRIIRQRVDKAVSLLSREDEKTFSRNWNEVENAIYLVGRLKLMDLVPQVQKLEECLFGSVLPYYADNRPVRIRRMAQFTLRRLGVKPRGYPAVSLPPKGSFQYRPFDQPFPERVEHADAIHSSMHMGEVVEKLGMPDYINSVNYVDPNLFSPTYWRYDMDTGHPYTLLVTFDKNVVHSIKRLEPPLWMEMEKIESQAPRQLFKPDGDLEWSTEWDTIERHYLGYRVWLTSFWLIGTIAVVFLCLFLIRRRMNRSRFATSGIS